MSFLKKLSVRRSRSPLMENDNRNLAVGYQPSVRAKSPTLHPNDAPPAYTPKATILSPDRPAHTADSPYAFLAQFDTIFVIDDSGSMVGRSWKETAAALGAITPICTEQDADGIDIYFLNHRNPYGSHAMGAYTNISTTPAVQEVFSTVRPSGGTPTGTRLNSILKNYIAELAKANARGRESSIKPLNIIVVTDGVATDDVESVIVSAAKKLDNMNAEPWQVGIQFFQVGQEPEAAADLKDLDDALASQHGVRDMVDTVPWSGVDGAKLTADGIMKVTMGAINRKLDRKKGNDEKLRRR